VYNLRKPGDDALPSGDGSRGTIELFALENRSNRPFLPVFAARTNQSCGEMSHANTAWASFGTRFDPVFAIFENGCFRLWPGLSRRDHRSEEERP
jgi:hypothetical protein